VYLTLLAQIIGNVAITRNSPNINTEPAMLIIQVILDIPPKPSKAIKAPITREKQAIEMR